MNGSIDFANIIIQVVYIIKLVVAFFSAFLLFGIMYSMTRTSEINEMLENKLKNWKTETDEFKISKDNQRWESIVKNLTIENEAGWRMSIIEADIMLDELLSKLVSPEGSVSDKLKQLKVNKMSSIQFAWEAHKVRNRIAHDGTNYHLSRVETKRVIDFYSIVFKEFGMI